MIEHSQIELVISDGDVGKSYLKIRESSEEGEVAYMEILDLDVTAAGYFNEAEVERIIIELGLLLAKHRGQPPYGYND